MSTTTETKATELREECIRVLCGQAPKNKKLLEDVFGETHAQSMLAGGAMEIGEGVRFVTAALSHILNGEPRRRPGRPKGSGKKRGRPPKKAAAEGADKPKKKRGRPRKKPEAKADETKTE